MNQWRLPLILCLSIVFGAPVLNGMLQSDGDMLVSGLKYVAALGLAWLGVSTIARIIDGFEESNRRRAQQEHEAAAAAEAQAAAEIRARDEARLAADGTSGASPRSDRAVA